MREPVTGAAGPGRGPGGEGASRIVVFKPGPIGDFLHSLPAVYALRERFPGARVMVVTGHELRDLVAANPAVDDKVFIPSTIFRGDPKGLLAFIGQVRAFRPDLFVDLKSNVKSFLVGRLSGARRVLRYRKQRRARRGERRLHAIENLLATVTPVTGEVREPRFTIVLSADDEERTEAFLTETLPEERRSAPKVAMNPTVGWAIPSRLWPPERFRALAEKILRETGCSVILTGAPADRGYLGEIAGGMDDPPVIAAGRLTLGQTAALIKRCDLLVSGDTGPLHIAAAVGTPVVGLYGSVSVERSRPWGGRHVVIKKDLWCLPCEEKVCPLSTMQCMTDISVEEVFDAVREALRATAK